MRRKREAGAYFTFFDYVVMYGFLIAMWLQLSAKYSG